ncbi:MAG: YicC/YloC family endoribonuclease [Sandaracinaceae bacterium]
MSDASTAPKEAGGIRSMTGHGVGEAPLGQGRVLVEIRAVNHRYLDVRVKLPTDVAEHGGAVEERVRRSLRRGRVEVQARLQGDVCGPPALDVDRARAAFGQLSALRDELRPGEPVPLSLLSCVPDLFSASGEKDHEAASEALALATDAACEEVWTMRGREGEALAADLSGHLDALLAQLASVQARVPEMVDGYRQRLRGRIERLLEDGDVSLDPGRLEHEVALFADRADIAEEIARLSSHAAQMRALLRGEDETAGKRLDFLLQEMTRETNTIGSKSADAALAQSVVEMKAAVSRMREQAQNIL